MGLSRHSHLLVVCTGAPVYEDFVTLIDLIANVSGREGWRTVLVDCTSVAPTFTEAERIALGQWAGKQLTGLYVGLVVSDPRRFSATQSAAATRGGTLQYFDTLDAANAWLDKASVAR
ncbi:hypothetical protein [Ramlibacter sp.]|uniref:STAS/SEC14 domain-containing protein n=2 Tax=Ramlibacter aquaticus TaxID=2780094 RepID=A0ABR9SB42_9BURK|nr:hypothetical protein [Ramlibacter sp.]MBE7939526.1 hypothetical protein [Ramlibacter aquaticus]